MLILVGHCVQKSVPEDVIPAFRSQSCARLLLPGRALDNLWRSPPARLDGIRCVHAGADACLSGTLHSLSHLATMHLPQDDLQSRQHGLLAPCLRLWCWKKGDGALNANQAEEAVSAINVMLEAMVGPQTLQSYVPAKRCIVCIVQATRHRLEMGLEQGGQAAGCVLGAFCMQPYQENPCSGCQD